MVLSVDLLSTTVSFPKEEYTTRQPKTPDFLFTLLVGLHAYVFHSENKRHIWDY